ncbi:MAG: RHS repeat domain-containing protein [Ginsengibacter sp.]
MIKKLSTFFTLFLLFLLLHVAELKAQYYYKDIWNTQQLSSEFSILKNEKLRTVKIKSFEDDNEPSEGFYCEKKINGSYTQSEMISKSYITGQSLLISTYDNDGHLTKTVDDTPTTNSTTSYEYDDKGRLTMVQIFTKGDDDAGSITETRQYYYDESGHPAKMERKKNNTLVAKIQFVLDDKNNVVEENVTDVRSTDKKYYYYYDDKNRLTDVVHFNDRAGKLLPDYIYEYNTSNQPVQMISAAETGDNYFIWRYSYNDKNLRDTERCFSKEKRLLGKIEYEYK